MTSLTHIFFGERLREYQNTIASSDPKYNEKLKEKELDDKYKDQMMEGCRVFAKKLEDINDKKFSLGLSSSLKYTISGADKYEYIYTGCPELKKFIAQFNSKNKLNQIKINVNDNSVDIAGTSPDGKTLSIYTFKKNQNDINKICVKNYHKYPMHCEPLPLGIKLFMKNKNDHQ
jgi:hypothetical protein